MIFINKFILLLKMKEILDYKDLILNFFRKDFYINLSLKIFYYSVEKLP